MVETHVRGPVPAGVTHSPPATERPWPPSPEEVGTALRAYEVMVILDPSLEERTVEPSLDKYLNVIRKDGGTVESVDVWGRRRLAYEINKNAEGIYAVIVAAPPSRPRSRSSTASSL